jgi:TonB family protein
VGGPPPLPPKQSSGCGKWILIGVLILVLIGVGIAGAVYYGYRYTEKTLKSSEAYTTAVASLRQNERVMSELGNIQDTGFPIGAYSQNSDGSGTAAFVMSVHGTKSTGQYQVELMRRAGVWHVVKGIFKTASGESINVVDEGSPTVDSSPPPPPPTGPISSDPRAKGAISGGVLNSKAIEFIKPAYPGTAKAAKAKGHVVVQVLVDESGNVVSARPVSGHPLLQAAAVAAAKQTKFPPAKLSGKPVKVIGILDYDFTPPE